MKAIWKGSIGFGLVSIPIKLYSAVTDSSLDLDMLDGRDHQHIKYQRINEKTRKEVAYDKIVKGYKLKDDYVILEEQDFLDASPEKSKVIALENFVKMADVNPMNYETSYYAEPDQQGKKPYLLLLKALQKSKKAGLGQFVLRQRAHLCLIYPLNEVLVVSRIRFAEEIRPADEILIPQNITISKKELDLGLALIDQYSADFNIGAYKDEFTSELLKIIKAKAKGKRVTVKKLNPKKPKSEDLFEQLMESLSSKKGA